MTSHSLNLDHMTTERRNSASESLDRMTAEEIVALMNAEDAQVAAAVSAESSAIAQAIDVIVDRLAGGGRLIYIGAGTSGRLGVLDASECPPTFNSPPGQVVGLIAGGNVALTSAVEGAEDQPEGAIRDLQAISLSATDVLVGIATSGRTPYVLGGLGYARDIGAYAIGLACNTDSEISRRVQLMIAPVVGPEVITGSSRLKAGTATKMVLNMLSTGAMVRLGKTFGNLMVDLQAKNQKLLERSRRIVAQLTGLSIEETERHLKRCGGDVKTAIVAHQRQLTPASARKLLSDVQGHLRTALESPLSED